MRDLKRQRHGFRDRHVRVNARDLAYEHRQGTLGSVSYPNREARIDLPRVLPERRVHVRPRTVGAVGQRGVAHDSHHAVCSRADEQLTVDHLGIRPQAARERFVHNRHGRRVVHIGIAEFAASQNRDAERFEVPRSDYSKSRPHRLAAWSLRLVERHIGGQSVENAAERDHCHARHGGVGLEALNDRAQESLRLGGRILQESRTQSHDDDAGEIESFAPRASARALIEEHGDRGEANRNSGLRRNERTGPWRTTGGIHAAPQCLHPGRAHRQPSVRLHHR